MKSACLVQVVFADLIGKKQLQEHATIALSQCLGSFSYDPDAFT